MIVHLIDGRVKGFASRGCRTKRRTNVLCVRIAIGERLWLLHRFLDGFEEAAGGTYPGRCIRHEIARSMEAYYYEAYTEREDAEGREKFLKSRAGRRLLRAQLRHYLKRFPARARESDHVSTSR